MTASEIYQAFEAQVKRIKGDNFFGRSRFNADRSCLRDLFRELRAQISRGLTTPLNRDVLVANLNRRSPKDHRKYLPAIEELCRKWPNGDYGGTIHIISAPLDTTPSRTVEPRAMTASRRDEQLWSRIEVTDIPTSTPGVYHHTANDSKTTTQKATASGQVLGKHIEGIDQRNMLERPEYWVSLGRLVLVSNAARCFGCAAAVIYTYCYENRHPDLWLEVVGSEGYDHHFVIVGRENDDVRDVENWGNGAFVIDVWQGNLSKQSISSVLRPQDCQYARDGALLKLFCSIAPTWRGYLNDYARSLGDFPTGRAVETPRPIPVVATQNVQSITPVQNNRPNNPLIDELRRRQQNVA